MIIDREGLVLTNAHVVEQVEMSASLLPTASSATVWWSAVTRIDLALVRLKGEAPPKPARLGDLDALDVGDWAIALGTPYGLERTVTLGIAGSLHRNISSPASTTNDWISSKRMRPLIPAIPAAPWSMPKDV